MVTQSSRTKMAFWGVDSGRKLYVRSYGDFILVPGDSELERFADFGEIFWPVSGTGSFHLDGKEHILKPGMVWYYPPGSFHKYQPRDVFHYCWLSIAGENAGNLFQILGLVPGLNPAGDCPEHLFALLDNDMQIHTAVHLVNALNTAFRILTCIQLGKRGSVRPEKSISEVRKIIDSTFSDPELSVARLAENLDMHRVSLSRSFSKAYGISVSDYIIHARLTAAMEMLRNSSIPIREVAENCGFASGNYFSKVFAAKTSLSPRAYRERYRVRE
ncbi:MAG: helix-turn-helix transcriptional regulator [Lentisphaeria bacterium]|nr:helix-turn-helix transcriptional regulator [Lentisphaeria bacterium]